DYTWIDKDKKSYNKLLDFKEKHNLQVLNLHCQSIGELSWGSYRENGYDLALMLKIVPVIFRQEKLLFNLLANIPANTYIITGSKEAMVKKKNIEDRENSVIQRFIGLTGKEVKRKFEIENEFGYVIS
nr:hypothetical protein [Patescibacteria group bacterium]